MFDCIQKCLFLFLCAVSVETEDSVRKMYAIFDKDDHVQVIYNDSGAVDSRALAWGTYEDAREDDGWAYLHLETNPRKADFFTAYAAGVLEAEVSRTLIGYQSKNRYENYCDKWPGTPCEYVVKFVQRQVDYMYEKASENRKQSAFWNQVNLLLQQLTGLSDAFFGRPLDPFNRFEPSENNSIMFVNWEADLFNIPDILRLNRVERNKASSKKRPSKKRSSKKGSLKKHSSRKSSSKKRSPKKVKSKRQTNVRLGTPITGLYTNITEGPNKGRSLGLLPGRCSALIKYFNDNIIIGHTSWFWYETMIRIQKKYRFHFRARHDQDSPRVEGGSIIMTSYPACIYSLDEFYLISETGLLVLETTLDLHNTTTMKLCKPTSVPTWIRAMVANRLSDSGKRWIENFSQENSGTYNNQYMIVDYHKFKRSGKKLKKDVFWILEQMPGKFISKDMTSHLNNTTFFPSFNIPYFEEMSILNGEKSYDEFTDFYQYDRNPRRLIFNRDHHGVRSVRDMMKMMRYNDYKNDELSVCSQCQPPGPVPTFAIAARGDLNNLWIYPIYIFEGPIGATDAKAIDMELFNDEKMTIINGPASARVPMFEWSSTEQNRPRGHPNAYAYPIVTHNFEKYLYKNPLPFLKGRSQILLHTDRDKKVQELRTPV